MRNISSYEGSFDIDNNAEPRRFSQNSQEQNSQEDTTFLTSNNIQTDQYNPTSPQNESIFYPILDEPNAQEAKDSTIIAANKNYKYHPHDYVHGLLSKQTFKDNVLGDNLQGDLQNWQVQAIYDDKKNSGYYGVLYVDACNCHTILAHQSISPNWWNVLSLNKAPSNQIEMLFGRTIVEQQVKSYIATQEAMSYSKQHQYHLSTTGFGFGALLAEISVYYGWWSLNYKLKAVTFESFGSLALIDKLKANVRNNSSCVNLFKLDIVTYLTMPNMLNCNGHLGTVYQIPLSSNSKNWQQQIAELFASTAYAEAAGATINTILQHIEPSKPPNILKVLDWPQLSYNNQTLFAITKFDSIGLCKAMLPLPNFLSKMLFDKVDKALCEYTPYSFIKLCLNMLAGNFSSNQYWLYKPQENLTPQQEFELIYAGHYRTEPVEHHNKAFNKDAGDEEYYLYKFKKYAIELQDYHGLRSIIKKQLAALNLEYDFITTGKKSTIHTQAITVQQLYTWVQRLAELYSAELDAAIQLVKKRQNHIQHNKIATDLPQPIAYFAGREKLLARIDKSLQANRMIAINGYGGVGKSALAAEYGRRLEIRHNIRWFNATSIEKLHEGYRCLAEELGITSADKNHHLLKNKIYAKLSGYGDILFIFDDVRHYSDIASYVNFPANIKLLITTKQQDLGFGSRKQNINIPLFSRIEAIDYIKNFCVDRIITEEEINSLIATIGLLPYRLNGALAYLRNNKLTSIAEYTTQYKNNAAKPTLLSGWAITIEKLATEDIISWEIAQYLAWLDADFIPISLLQQLGYSYAELQHAEKLLSSFSIASLVTRGTHIAGFCMQKLLQEDVRIYADIRKDISMPIAETLLKLTAALANVFPSITDNPSAAWQTGQLYATCVTYILNNLPLYISGRQYNCSDSLLIAKLYTKLADYTAKVELDYAKSLEYHRACLAIELEITPNNYADIASAYSNIGRALEKTGQPQEGLFAKQQALALYHKEYGEAHVQIAKELGEIGWLYQILGDNTKTFEYSEISVEMYNTLCIQEHPQFVMALTRLGGAYQKLNNFTQGLHHINAALEMGERLYDKNHPVIASLYSNLSIAQYKCGNPYSALEHIEKSINIYKHCYHSEHHLLASAYSNMGVIYGALGDVELNLHYNKEALSICNNLFSPPNHRTANVLCNIGIAYQQLRDIPRAVQYLTESLSIYKLIYHAEHPKIGKITGKLDFLLSEASDSSPTHKRRLLDEEISIPNAKKCRH